jgi:DNA-directed RNA polymerase subunit RPC12/RpoP
MITREFVDQLTETLMYGGIGLSAIVLIGSNTIRPNPLVATASTVSAIGFTVSVFGLKRKENIEHLKAEKIRFEKLAQTVQGNLKETERNFEHQIRMERAKTSERADLETKYQSVKSAFDQRASELNQALEQVRNLQYRVDALNVERAEWSSKFDVMIAGYEKDLQAERDRSSLLERENMGFKAQFSSIEEVAKLRANAESRALEDKLKELNSEYTKVATLYNSAVTDLKKLNAEYVSEFSELNEAVSKGIPNAFEAVLDSRDQELMRLSGHLSILIQPQYFESIGEFERVNRLIKALYESEQSITLDASEIVPYADQTGFDVFLNLRDRKARGQAFIDALNDRGNEFSVLCGCVKDLKFEYDRVNPHRIKTAMVFRKKSAIGTKTTIDKIWIQRDKFSDRILALLKKPSTRVMGATGQGKGIFVNLLLAVIANQPKPPIVRLHDPVDGSSEDYWQLPKSSSGSKAVKRALAEFRSEFDQRKISKLSTPAILEIFDEIDALAIEDSNVTKDILYCATGIRHTGQKAIFIGQSPNVGKKGWQWADMDSFNCVYIGTSALQAIQNSPILQPKKEKLEKQYQDLQDYCIEQNEELGLDDWNAYRFALVVSDGVVNWVEIPNADSIVCDWQKLTTALDNSEETIQSAPENDGVLVCPECGSDSLVKFRGDTKTKAGVVTKYRKCKDCNHEFKLKDSIA